MTLYIISPRNKINKKWTRHYEEKFKRLLNNNTVMSVHWKD